MTSKPHPTADTEVCTGLTATWCPIHGDCICPPKGPDFERDLNDDLCPLHSWSSPHAEKVEDDPRAQVEALEADLAAVRSENERLRKALAEIDELALGTKTADEVAVRFQAAELVAHRALLDADKEA